MKVLYDYQIFVEQKYGGISRYFFELLNSYQEDGDIDAHISLALSNNHYIQGCTFTSHHNFFPKANFRGKGSLIKAINKINTIGDLHAKTFDIFHPTYYDPYFLKHIGNKPFVLTVYDMIHEKFEEMLSAYEPIKQRKTTQFKKLLVHKASHIIAISKSTKQDLMELFDIQESKISVVHLGNSLVLTDNATQLPPSVPEQFILFVGGRSLHKNFVSFIRAMARELQKRKDLSVICVGGDRFSPGELSLFRELGIAEQVLLFDTDDSTLGLFYKNALFFVFPSLYEGFGIPILEAFACNCPLLCSNTSSFPEVAGDAALYFDPESIDSMHSAILTAIENKDLRSELQARGSLQAKQFSLDKTALETKNIYNRLL